MAHVDLDHPRLSPDPSSWQSPASSPRSSSVLIIGALGRLFVPGKQNISNWLTLLIGIIAALLGTPVAGVFGVADTRGIDWIELAPQVGFAAIGVSIASGASGRRR